jgi:hypothetical protein
MLRAQGIGDIGLWVGKDWAEEARRLIRDAEAGMLAAEPEESGENQASEG